MASVLGSGDRQAHGLQRSAGPRLLGEGPLVLALGGGAFLNDQTRRIIAERATSIWLTADIDVLLARVNRKPGKRPLLAGGNPREILNELSKARTPIYARADVEVASSRTSKTKTRDDVLESLHRYLKQQTQTEETPS